MKNLIRFISFLLMFCLSLPVFSSDVTVNEALEKEWNEFCHYRKNRNVCKYVLSRCDDPKQEKTYCDELRSIYLLRDKRSDEEIIED